MSERRWIEMLWVDPETQARAYNAVDEMFNLRKAMRGIKLRMKRGLYPTFMSDEARERSREIERERLRKMEERLRMLEDMFVSHPVGMLAVCQRLPKPFAAMFVAAPPQVTTKRTGPLIKTTNWIANCFLVVRMRSGNEERKHAPKIAKLGTECVVSLLNYGVYKKVFPDPVKRFLEEKVRQYEKTKGRRAAKIIAIKDAARVLIGNAWLVWTWMALEAEIIRPQDIVLPYHLAKDPFAAQTMIDPVHTFIDVPSNAPEILARAVKEASWVKLVKIVGWEP